MIKRGFLDIFIAILVLYVPYSQCMSTTTQWAAENIFNSFMVSPCSDLLLKPIQKGTESLFEQPEDQKNIGIQPSRLQLFLARYMPSVTSGVAALGAYKLASWQGYNHWMAKSLVLGALGNQLYTLIAPRIVYQHNDVASRLLGIDAKSPLYHWINKEKPYYLSPGAYVLSMLGMSIKNIQRIETTLNTAGFTNMVANSAIRNVISIFAKQLI